MRATLPRTVEPIPDTRLIPGVFFYRLTIMINRYLFELIFSVMTLCGVLLACVLFLTDSVI
ncbi:hypothetical protein B4907_08060 [Yersinia kristensenii]|nr:hypothetical protein ykris0001_8510 [Yersinia kristensenii ATCC 33638]OWF84459.1 hypothetical protein B4907_08060 [Yersinia kristensenii]PEH53505.1 hypothetical protein CRM81_09245 [Yersinia kristensenii]